MWIPFWCLEMLIKPLWDTDFTKWNHFNTSWAICTYWFYQKTSPFKSIISRILKIFIMHVSELNRKRSCACPSELDGHGSENVTKKCRYHYKLILKAILPSKPLIFIIWLVLHFKITCSLKIQSVRKLKNIRRPRWKVKIFEKLPFLE